MGISTLLFLAVISQATPSTNGAAWFDGQEIHYAEEIRANNLVINVTQENIEVIFFTKDVFIQLGIKKLNPLKIDSKNIIYQNPVKNIRFDSKNVTIVPVNDDNVILTIQKINQ